MIDRGRPPKNRKGWRWEYRDGCQGECSAATCHWFGNCKGEDTPHWLEVKMLTKEDAIALLLSSPTVVLDDESVRNAEDDESGAVVVLDIGRRDEIVALLKRHS